MGTTATGRPRNRSWPEALKRDGVAASFAPGSSVSIVARQYDVNANQVFNWRKRVWLAVGRTDMRRGMNGLALQVQETLRRDPHAGDLYVFRGARGNLIKVL